jgi:hypothetical protein
MRGVSTNGSAVPAATSIRQMRRSFAVAYAVAPSSMTTTSSIPGSADGTRSNAAAKSADRSTAAMACSVEGSMTSGPAMVISGRGAVRFHHTTAAINATPSLITG